MNKVNSKILLSIMLCFFCVSLHASDTKNGIYEQIAQENLKTLTDSSLQSDAGILSDLINDDKEFYQVLEETFEKQKDLGVQEKRRLVFAMLAAFEQAEQGSEQHHVDEDCSMDTISWKDLQILCGSGAHPELYLAQKLDRTCTEVGRAMLYHRLITPTADIEELKKRQNAVKAVCDDEQLREILDKNLNVLQTSENILLSLWDDGMYESMIQHFCIKFPFEKEIDFLKDCSQSFNESPLLLEINHRLNDTKKVIGTALMGLSVATLSLRTLSILARETSWQETIDSINEYFRIGDHVTEFSLPGLLFFAMEKLGTDRELPAMKAAKGTIAAVNNGRHLNHLIDGWWYVDSTYLRCIHEKLNYIALYLRNVKALIDDEQISRANIPEIQRLKKAYEEFDRQSEEMEQFVALLEQDTFKEEPSYYTYLGQVIAAYKLLGKVKGQFGKLMMAVGDVDVLLSTARLYTEIEQEGKTPVCFAEFVENQSMQPLCEQQDFWNPLLDRDKAIVNSLTLGEQERTSAIITGPNAGGKSTTMKAFFINALIPQTLTIACAKQCKLKPFHIFRTYLNITDDIAAGNSHFKAGVLRARDLMDIAERTNQMGKSCLMAVDEVFNGTTFEEGQAAAYAFIKQLGEYEHVSCISPTHFPILTNLQDQTKSFTNYKVSVEYDRDGNFSYPYKLERGIAHQNIAFDILYNEGFGDQFLNQAKAVLSDTAQLK
ncbi:MAG: hypothetical protein H6679_03095 [Epsilonproteobacteria bacterium]|nr:hypothetical protein [Campylobacterota bacterium]